jgi:plastocyanin
MTARRRTALALAAACLLAACGGGGYGSPGSPSPNPGPSQPTIRITASGVSPRDLTIDAGQRVLFANSDSRAHQMNSDPHPEHGECPEIDQVGFLSPGQSRETGNFVRPHTCGYHDHNLSDNASLKGRIIIR